MRPTRTTTLGVAAVLVATVTSLLTPNTPETVNAAALEAAGLTAAETVLEERIIPAPEAAVPAVLVDEPQVPELPQAATARDEPVLTAHVQTVNSALATSTSIHAQAKEAVEEATARLGETSRRLEDAQKKAASAGAPVPAEPALPDVPAVITTDGQALPREKVDQKEIQTEAQTRASNLPAAPKADEENVGNVNEQVEAIEEGLHAQTQVARAQAELVSAITVAEVTEDQVTELQGALAAGQHALATLPGPDPRWPDGCPTEAPSNTLRNGAEGIGIWQLCADSVAAAPTPEAATAIKWALSNVGIPYSQGRRNEAGYADCSSYLTRAYTAGGIPLTSPGVNAPTTSTIATAPWANSISYQDALPGDLVLPAQGHVVMVLAHGYIVHTSTDGDVSHVRSSYESSPWLTKRIG